MLKKAEIQASSFDKLRIRSSGFNDLHLMVSLSKPWATSFFSSLLELRFRRAEGRSQGMSRWLRLLIRDVGVIQRAWRAIRFGQPGGARVTKPHEWKHLSNDY